MNMKVSPSEIIYWEILPSIRKEIVFCLKDEGLKQSQIADILEITPSAVSQYINKKRGDLSFSSSFKEIIKKEVSKIINNKKTPFEATNFLIKEFQKNKEICKVCSTKNKLDTSCNTCYD